MPEETIEEVLRDNSTFEKYLETKMKMKPIEQLKAEHDAVKLALRILSRVCKKLENGEDIKPGHLN